MRESQDLIVGLRLFEVATEVDSGPTSRYIQGDMGSQAGAPNHSTPDSSPARVNMRTAPACRHCGGTGLEPRPLEIYFSKEGPTRGEQQKLADATGLSQSHLSKIFAGETAPSALTLIRLARYYRTSVDRILRIPVIWKRVREEERQ